MTKSAKELPLGTVSNLMKLMAGGAPSGNQSDVKAQADRFREAYLLAVDDWFNSHPNQIHCLLIDAFDQHFYLLAERHHIPYILFESSIPALLSSPHIPPTLLGWDYSDSWFGTMRDQLAQAILGKVINSFFSTVQNKYAQAWSLPRSKGMGDSREIFILF